MKGGEQAKWSDVDMADHFLDQAKSYVGERAKSEEPFFYFMHCSSLTYREHLTQDLKQIRNGTLGVMYYWKLIG